MEDNIQKIYGLIGNGLLAYMHYYYNSYNSPLVIFGYVALALGFIPWYLNSEIYNKNTEKKIKKEKNVETYLEKIGHSLISAYFATHLMKDFDIHSFLGLAGNLLILTKYKKQAIITLIGFYLLSIIQTHGSIGSMSLILFYYYQLEKA
jgi:hypothetical protein